MTGDVSGSTLGIRPVVSRWDVVIVWLAVDHGGALGRSRCFVQVNYPGANHLVEAVPASLG